MYGDGRRSAASGLCSAAWAIREEMGTPLFAAAERGYRETLAGIGRDLDAETIATLLAEGRAMTLEQAIAYALEEEDGGDEA